jgi:hypothetical protein
MFIRKAWFCGVAMMLCACSSSPPSGNHYADHAVITQNGLKLTPVSVQDGIYKYVITTEPFSILVPSTDPQGHAYDINTAWVHLCARYDLTSFAEVVPGVYSQNTGCAGSENATFWTPVKAMAGIDMYVSRGITNIVDHAPLAGPEYNTINVAHIVDTQGSMRCFEKNLPCSKRSYAKAGEKPNGLR